MEYRTVRDLVEALGGTFRAAERFKVGGSAVSNWLGRNALPAFRRDALEQAVYPNTIATGLFTSSESIARKKALRRTATTEDLVARGRAATARGLEASQRFDRVMRRSRAAVERGAAVLNGSRQR